MNPSLAPVSPRSNAHGIQLQTPEVVSSNKKRGRNRSPYKELIWSHDPGCEADLGNPRYSPTWTELKMATRKRHQNGSNENNRSKQTNTSHGKAKQSRKYYREYNASKSNDSDIAKPVDYTWIALVATLGKFSHTNLVETVRSELCIC